MLLLSLGVAGCKDKDKPKQVENAYTNYELAMTEEDTTAVAGLVNLFFEYVENDRITDAVAMLYQPNDSDVYGPIELLDNENIDKVTSMLKSFPIVNHRIDYIKFHEVYANEVKVSAIMVEATDDIPEVKTVFYFRPIDYLGQWCLCLMSSDKDNQRLISSGEADSVSTKYSDYQKEKEKQRNSTSE